MFPPELFEVGIQKRSTFTIVLDFLPPDHVQLYMVYHLSVVNIILGVTQYNFGFKIMAPSSHFHVSIVS